MKAGDTHNLIDECTRFEADEQHRSWFHLSPVVEALFYYDQEFVKNEYLMRTYFVSNRYWVEYEFVVVGVVLQAHVLLLGAQIADVGYQ